MAQKKVEKNSSILENFIKNFWSQLKEPTHFRLIRMTIHDYKQNKQAIKDLSQGKETDTVKEFLKRYEIRPRENREQSKNEKEKETMAKKQNPQEKHSNRYKLRRRRSSRLHATVTTKTW